MPLLALNLVLRGETMWPIRVGLVLVSVLLAWVRYQAVKKPFRKLDARKTAAVLAIIMICLYVGGVLISAS